MENSLKNILIAHNKYIHYGGEDSVVESEVKMLRKYGHNVYVYERENSLLKNKSKLKILADSVWSKKTVKDLEEIFKEFKPDVIHVHNTLPQISPSIYWVASKYNIPAIQTIHNFRLSCLQAMFLRNNKICELCKGKLPLKGIINKCYRDSFAASTTLAISLIAHRVLGTYKRKINIYIALNEFCKEKLIEMGVPKSKILIKPNFVQPPKQMNTEKNGNPLYVGRLSEEKGIQVLVNAIKSIPKYNFDVAGDGPKKSLFKNAHNVNLLGNISQQKVIDLMSNAPFIIVPSLWYENMPRTIVESFSMGTPVIASDIGALSRLVDHGKTGLLFKTGSTNDLIRTIKWSLREKKKIMKMGVLAKEKYNINYTEDVNYRALTSIYNHALSTNK
ncbi:hypothetical protein A3194_10465 [Candidatus Thiodiazotropha endoloripes]|uniref:glycosyltransferase n=1 Tax=Candidatus Thiodiazotropha endoloripes TaxID=1818881 RepID=UPI00083D9241|nr:glycosyltransferase [Candidatus Thiodiazotropha endoloripes]ODB89575.1 hypothetical protein A3194_10465 [Candidatus Thiodiazotropha endoloripes]